MMSKNLNFALFVFYIIMSCASWYVYFYGRSLYKSMKGDARGYKLRYFLKELSRGDFDGALRAKVDRLLLLDRVLIFLFIIFIVLFFVILIFFDGGRQ